MRLEHQQASQAAHPVDVRDAVFHRQRHPKKASPGGIRKASASARFTGALDCHA